MVDNAELLARIAELEKQTNYLHNQLREVRGDISRLNVWCQQLYQTLDPVHRGRMGPPPRS